MFTNALKFGGLVLGLVASARAANYVIDRALGLGKALFTRRSKKASAQPKKTLRRGRRPAVAHA